MNQRDSDDPQPNATLQGGKYRKLRLSDCQKNLFLIGRAGADYSIERKLGQGGFGNNNRIKTF